MAELPQTSLALLTVQWRWKAREEQSGTSMRPSLGKQKDPLHFFLKPANPARFRLHNWCLPQRSGGGWHAWALWQPRESVQVCAGKGMDGNQACASADEAEGADEAGRISALRSEESRKSRPQPPRVGPSLFVVFIFGCSLPARPFLQAAVLPRPRVPLCCDTRTWRAFPGHLQKRNGIGSCFLKVHLLHFMFFPQLI